MKSFIVVLGIAAFAISGCTLAGQSPVGGAGLNLGTGPVLNAPAAAYVAPATSLSVATAPVCPVVDEPTFGVRRGKTVRLLTVEK